MRQLLLLFILLPFSFCSKKRESDLPRIVVPEVDNVIEVNTNSMLNISSKSNLLGNFDKDTIIEEKISFNTIPKNNVIFKNRDTIFPRYDFKIIIDTSYSISIKGFEYKNIKLPKKELLIKDGLINGKIPTQLDHQKQLKIINNYADNVLKLHQDFIKCYPLLIYNMEKKSSYIRRIRLIQQAKNENGNWKPIEFLYSPPSCLVDNYFYKFKPSKYLAIPLIKYHGKFKTKLRVKVQINDCYYYSNEIEGFINKGQFDEKFAKDYLDLWSPNYKGDLDTEYLNYVFLKEDL
jgi:hypothetical protein